MNNEDTPLERQCQRRLRENHQKVLEELTAAGDAVAEDWDGPSLGEGRKLVEALRGELERRGLLEALTDVLIDLVAATGHRLQAPPVAGPPYVVVASRGPLCRATIDPGRLVVQFELFEPLEDTRHYRRLEAIEPTVALR